MTTGRLGRPRRPRHLARLILTASLAATASCATTAHDPARPLDRSDRLSEEYRAEAYSTFRAIISAWAHGVSEGNVGAVVRLYGPDALVELDRSAEGPAVPGAVQAWMAGVESVLTGPADFDASADLAYGVVRVLIVLRERGRVPGLMTVVVRRYPSGWLIRSQLLTLPDP